MRRLAFAAILCLVVLGPWIGCGGKFLEEAATDGGLDATKPDATGDAVADVVAKPDAPPPPGCKGDADCKDGSKPRCDPATKACVGCLGDVECGGAACCAHQCVDTTADGKNCGACGNACGAGSSCCSANCADTQSSLANCGACGKPCAPSHVTAAQCTSGACGYTSCSAPYSDCDGVKSNGCESDTTTDANNCGVCGNKCALGQQCAGGACTTCGPDEVSYQGHCYYLDGSYGLCDSGYARASEAVLAQVATLFQGKNYKHTVSDFCCIWTSDVASNWGMTYPSGTCNKPGPIQAGEPSLGGANCNNITYHSGAKQLTFCGK